MEAEPPVDERDIIDLLNEGIARLEAGREDDADAFEIVAQLSDIFDGAVPAELNENAPLKLEQAICLPELNGSYTVNPDLRIPSESLSIKTLRKAIADGHLAVLRPNSKNLFTTQRAVKEWLASCLDPVNPRISNSGRNDATVRDALRTKPFISSTTTINNTALDAALTTLQALKDSSKRT